MIAAFNTDVETEISRNIHEHENVMIYFIPFEVQLSRQFFSVVAPVNKMKNKMTQTSHFKEPFFFISLKISYYLWLLPCLKVVSSKDVSS